MNKSLCLDSAEQVRRQILAHVGLLALGSLLHFQLSNLCGSATAWDVPLENAGHLKCHIWWLYPKFTLRLFFFCVSVCTVSHLWIHALGNPPTSCLYVVKVERVACSTSWDQSLHLNKGWLWGGGKASTGLPSALGDWPAWDSRVRLAVGTDLCRAGSVLGSWLCGSYTVSQNHSSVSLNFSLLPCCFLEV